jgi:hypothetical protein
MVRAAAEMEEFLVAVPLEVLPRMDEAEPCASLPAVGKGGPGQHMNDPRRCVTDQEHIHSGTFELQLKILDGLRRVPCSLGEMGATVRRMRPLEESEASHPPAISSEPQRVVLAKA